MKKKKQDMNRVEVIVELTIGEVRELEVLARDAGILYGTHFDAQEIYDSIIDSGKKRLRVAIEAEKAARKSKIRKIEKLAQEEKTGAKSVY